MNVNTTSPSRVLTENTRLLKPVKDKRTGQFIPMIWLSGRWLSDFGFDFNAVITAVPFPNKIMLSRAEVSTREYLSMVRQARMNKTQLLQVCRSGRNLCISLSGQCLTRAGFNAGDYFLADCTFGVISVTACHRLLKQQEGQCLTVL